MQLEGTKSQDGSMTMLHFLAQVLEEKYPDILGFLDETIHIEKAARGNPGIHIVYVFKSLVEISVHLKKINN